MLWKIIFHQMALKSTIGPLVARACEACTVFCTIPMSSLQLTPYIPLFTQVFCLGLNISILQILNWKIKDPLWPSILHLRMGVCKPNKVWFSWIDLLFHPAVGIKQARWNMTSKPGTLLTQHSRDVEVVGYSEGNHGFLMSLNWKSIAAFGFITSRLAFHATSK